MYPWDCCRLCLSVQSLHPIFSIPEQQDKYKDRVFAATGVKVELNDSLPQNMCMVCINYINDSYKFRKKCEENQKTLQDRLTDKQVYYEIKIETNNIEHDRQVMIDISDDINDLKTQNDEEFNENESNDTFERDEEPIIVFKSKNSKKTEKPVRRKLRSKKDSGEKKQKFRKKCEENQKTLQDRLTDNPIYEIEIETNNIENDKQVMIDISDDINDLKTQNDNEEYNDNERDEEPIIAFKSKNSKKTEEPVRRKLRSKKESGEKKEREKEEIECEYCHKILTSKLSLRNHYKIHTGFDVVCEHCGKKFITRRLLLMHCRAKHGYEKTDKCSFCDYRASNAEQVKIHERLHTGEKPYACAECGAGFHRRSSYLQHIAIHLPDKTVQCDQCPARFKSVTLMRIHKNRHRAPQYTFQCRVCDNSFARRRNVARHLQRIHGLQPDHQHIHRVKIA